MNLNVTLIVKVSAWPSHFHRIAFFPGHSFSEVYRWEGKVCLKRSWQMSFHVWMIKIIRWVTNVRVRTQMNWTSLSPFLLVSLLSSVSLFLFFNCLLLIWVAVRRVQQNAATISTNYPPEPEKYEQISTLYIVSSIFSQSAMLCLSLIPLECTGCCLNHYDS